MPALVQQADLLICGMDDFEKILHLDTGRIDKSDALDRSKKLAELAMAAYPQLSSVAITLRESVSASHNNWRACLSTRRGFYVSHQYSIEPIVDRVGGGDSFCGGLIFGLNHYEDEKEALEFAAAAGCLKLTIPGDFNRVSVSEVEHLMKSTGDVRVQR